MPELIQKEVFGVGGNEGGGRGTLVDADLLGGGDELGFVIVTFCFGWPDPPGNPCKICRAGAVACSCGYPKLLKVAASCLLAGFGILTKRMLGLFGGS